ncbi:MAG: nucleotidyl transferase AbiEii/AbiGii toxin family protein [Actinobacteria bacterium]|nr:nucleotidyl transferase AbiEii/AbiGii toxin family protein [Actinomycetota bacterium]
MASYRERRDFAATIDAAAGQLGVSPAIIEKDYWVTQALRVLAREFPDDFIFKGGTSLSKCCRLIQRFSEDVDVLIIPRESKGATHRLMEQMASAVEGVLGGPVTVGPSRRGEHRTVRIQYPATHKGSGLLLPDVMVEAGIRGGPQPCERLPVGCILGDTLQEAGERTGSFEDLQSFDVEVLHPGRTLMEKLGLLHSKIGADPAEAGAARHVRHYYDVYMLLGDDHALAVLRDKAEFGRILASMREVNDRWFGGGELRPAGGWAVSPAFDTAGPAYPRLQRAYDSALSELYLGRDEPPALDAICARVAELADLL